MKQGSVGDKISQFCIVLFLTLWGLLILYPFYNSLLVSLVRQETYIKTPFMIFPKEITFESYAYVFRSQYIWSGYKVTLFVVVVGVTYSLFLTVTMAYALSRKYFPGKNFVLNLIIITMFFSGGLVPYYLLVKSLHLIDSVFSMIIPQGVNTFYMLILRNYFQTIPESLEESAKLMEQMIS